MASLHGVMKLWKARALAKCKFFWLLLLHDRLWTAARRKRHGLQNKDGCVLYDQEQETARHLAGEYVYAREIWFRVLAPIGLASLTPPPGVDYLDWWLQSRAQLTMSLRKGYDSLVILGAWCLWKEHNQRVFHGVSHTPVQLAVVVEEVDHWSQAGFSHLAVLWVSRDPG